ncbi:MAG: hypothetical protein ABIE14_00380, partial [Patescibacteria group bacterium]
MQIRKLAAADFPLIEDFLARQEFLPIQQAPVWGEFQKSLGNEVFRVGAVERGVLLAYAQIFVKKLPLGFTKIEAPRAPLGDSRFFPEILAVIE